MNKDVHNYLVEKNSANPQNNTETKNLISFMANAITNIKNGGLEECKKIKAWLEEKGEQIKESLQNDGSKLAQTALKLFMTLSLATAISINTTACGTTPINGEAQGQQGIQGGQTIEGWQQVQSGQISGYTPVETTRSPEEIEETGLTANDVLAAYDELARDSYDAFYGVKYDSDGNKIYEYIPTFESISPMSMEYNDGNGNLIPFQYPFFYKEKQFTPFFAWFREEGNMFYGMDTNSIPNAYLVSLNIKLTKDKKLSDLPCPYWTIPNNMMRKLMSAFGVTEFKITEELANSSSYPSSVYDIAMGQKVFSPITISRETIQNASPEQLEVLMEAVRYMYSCNFYCEMPDNETDYNFEIE